MKKERLRNLGAPIDEPEALPHNVIFGLISTGFSRD